MQLCYHLELARQRDRPVLIGTGSVQDSEEVCYQLSKGLKT
jgi:hypothetical protein